MEDPSPNSGVAASAHSDRFHVIDDDGGTVCDAFTADEIAEAKHITIIPVKTAESLGYELCENCQQDEDMTVAEMKLEMSAALENGQLSDGGQLSKEDVRKIHAHVVGVE